MNLIHGLLLCALLSFGASEQRGAEPGRASTEFAVVEARLEEPTPQLKKKLAEIEESLATGKMTAEQAEKRRSQAQRGQALLLFGYFGTAPRVIEVQRSDADAVGWSATRRPSGIRFDRIPPVKGGSKVLDTPLSSMPRKGWEVVDSVASIEARYRVHPWLQQPSSRAISFSLAAELTSTRFLPASAGTSSSTAVGSFTTGGAPARWATVLSFESDQQAPFVGYFDLIDSTGKSLGRVEIERPLKPKERRDAEIMLYADPRTSQGLRLQSIVARTAPGTGGEASNPGGESVTPQ
jgi:hypothetical protein